MWKDLGNKTKQNHPKKAKNKKKKKRGPRGNGMKLNNKWKRGCIYTTFSCRSNEDTAEWLQGYNGAHGCIHRGPSSSNVVVTSCL